MLLKLWLLPSYFEQIFICIKCVFQDEVNDCLNLRTCYALLQMNQRMNEEKSSWQWPMGKLKTLLGDEVKLVLQPHTNNFSKYLEDLLIEWVQLVNGENHFEPSRLLDEKLKAGNMHVTTMHMRLKHMCSMKHSNSLEVIFAHCTMSYTTNSNYILHYIGRNI